MKWQRLGLVFHVDENAEWMNSHATLPIPLHLEGDRFRIFFSTRDKSNRSHGSYLELDLKSPETVLKIADAPVLGPGKLGHFDDSGVSLSCFCPDSQLLYYMGWNLPKTVPFANQIGAARFSAGTKLERLSVLPVLKKTEKESLSFGYPWVLKAQGSYRMWYDTIFEWQENSIANYRFELRSAHSADGIHWVQDDLPLIPLEEGELAIARPCVIFEHATYKMWYCVNQRGLYRLGYAESKDGKHWEKRTDAGLSPSGEGWDSEEIAYPLVFDHKGQRYLLYNGNRYGKTGFGLARLIS